MGDHIGEKPARGAEVEVTEPSHLEARHVPMVEIPLDLDDPHRAALEDNPERAEKLTWTTLLAVIVRSIFAPRFTRQCY
jgi:hypothetical protein